MPATSLRRTAIVQLILATAAWGLSFPLLKMLFAIQGRHAPEAGTVFLSAHAIGVRSLLAVLVLLAFNRSALRGLKRAEWTQGALLGFFGGCGLMLQADGLNYTPASVSAFLTQFYCVLLPAWVCLYLKKWPSLLMICCTLMVVAGMVILSGFDWRTLHLGRGEWETLASAVFFTVQIQLLDRPAWRGNRMVPVSILMFVGFVVVTLPVLVWKAPSISTVFALYQNWPELIMMAIVTLFCTVYAYTAMNKWQPYVSAVEGGLIYCLEPVYTTIYTLFLPAWLAAACGVPYANEVLTTAAVTGGLLITGANILLQMSNTAQEK